MNVKIGIVAEMGGPGKVLLMGKVMSSTAKPIAGVSPVRMYLLIADVVAEVVAILQSQRCHSHPLWISS